LGLPSSLVFLCTHAALLPDPGRPSTTSPWRLFCFGFWNTKTIAVCFIIIDEAVSSFRECGLSYGLRAPCVRFNRFVRSLTAPPHGCNTRYEWLVRPYSTGAFTQSETPSFAWRTSDLIRNLLCVSLRSSAPLRLLFLPIHLPQRRRGTQRYAEMKPGEHPSRILFARSFLPLPQSPRHF